MSDPYAHLREEAENAFGKDSLQRLEPIFDIRDELYSMSPFKVWMLLEQALGDQGSNALIVTRDQYYRAVVDEMPEITERCSGDIDEFSKAFNRYARHYALWGVLQGAISFLGFLLILLLFLLFPLVVAAYYLHSPIHVRYLPSQQVTLLIFATALIALISTPLWAKLIAHRMSRLYESRELRSLSLYSRLVHEFQIVVVSLIQATHDRRRDPMLRSDRAPTLVEMESARILPSETFDEVVSFLKLHVTSALGIAGRRGAGKSTLLRWLAYDLEPDWIAVYVPAPAVYDAVDFARTIFRVTVNKVLTSYQSQAAPARSRAWGRVISAFRPSSAQDKIVRISNDVLNLITESRTDQWTTSGGLSAKGASVQRQKQTTVTEREPSHPELISLMTQYLEAYRRLEGRSIVIAIDELDKLGKAEDAINAINSLKDLFHLPNTHFVVSVSEDAMVRFVMRGIPFRDVFDSAFDDIIQVKPPSPETSWKMLAHRAGGFPIPVAFFCYAWSGGVPRDLIRTARACVDVRRRAGRPVKVTELVPPIVRCDIRDALDAVLAGSLEGKSAQKIEALLALRRNIEDRTFSLEDMPQGADVRPENTDGDEDKDHVLMLERLALYMDLGRIIVSYFARDFDKMADGEFEDVVAVVSILARAKFALATYPSETEWLLSQALRVIAEKKK